MSLHLSNTYAAMMYGYPTYGLGMGINGLGLGMNTLAMRMNPYMNPYAFGGMRGPGQHGVGAAASMMAYPPSYLGMGGVIADPMTSAYLAQGGSTMLGGYRVSPLPAYGVPMYG